MKIIRTRVLLLLSLFVMVFGIRAKNVSAAVNPYDEYQQQEQGVDVVLNDGELRQQIEDFRLEHEDSALTDEEVITEGRLSGWLKNNGRWSYYHNGKRYQKQWLFFQEAWYWFDEQGNLLQNVYFQAWNKAFVAREWGAIYQDEKITFEGETYWADPDGYLYTGTVKLDGITYHFAADGRLLSVDPYWVHLQNGDYNYVKADGSLAANEWLLYKGDWYYFDQNGRMYSEEFFTVDGSLYYARGWGNIYMDTLFTVDGKQYAAKSWGALYTNCRATIKGVSYVFNENGQIMPSNCFEKVGNDWIYYKEDGQLAKLEWIYYNKAWYYFDQNGIMLSNTFFEEGGSLYYARSWGAIYTNAMFTIDGKQYAARSWGALYTSCQATINGVRYTFNEHGEVITPNSFVKNDGKWVYYKADGHKAVREWIYYNKFWYYFDEEGIMYADTAFQAEDGKFYYARSWGGIYMNTFFTEKDQIRYATSTGALALEWFQVNNTYYYAKEDGILLTNEFLKYNGNLYYLQDDGKMATGWMNIEGQTYYFKDWGAAIVDDTQVINGSRYTFDQDGVLVTKAVNSMMPDGQYMPENAQVGVKTIQNFLTCGLQAVGRVLYIWGGGHSDPDLDHIGLNPNWEDWFMAHDSSYNYENYQYKTNAGLDCSGFAGWAGYQVMLETCTSYSGDVPYLYSRNGWGTVTGSYKGTFYPGDVVARNGHVWLIVGECSDSSVVVMHATPQYVQISGTVTRSGKTDSEAIKLARHYMETYYPLAYARYGNNGCGMNYFSDVARFTWDSQIMSDVNEMKDKSAEEVLKLLFGEE